MTHTHAWAAGLLEGEGFFDLKHGTLPLISCEMTDEDVVGLLPIIFGGVCTPQKQRKENWKPTWRWRIYGDEAITAMNDILPWMRERRSNKIKSIIASYAIVKQNRLDKLEQHEEAARLWLNKEGSLREIAKLFHISHETIRSTALRLKAESELE
jgi:hypothetical protein